MAGGGVQRVPEDAPLVVRTDPRKFRLWTGIPVLTGMLIMTCLVGVFLYYVTRSVDPLGRGFLWALGVTVYIGSAAAMAAPVLIVRQRFIGRGPLLAVDEGGVWVRRTRIIIDPPGATRLPWHAISAVHVNRMLFEDIVWIETDPRSGVVPPGTRFPVTTLMSDHTAGQILSAVAHLSAGRVPVR